MRTQFFLSCLLFCLIYGNLYAQQSITISGSVMNQNGQPLQGATVMQTSSSNITLTNKQGQFKLLVSSQEATLEISYTGYITATLPLNSEKVIHIVLKEATSNLDEVVIVGYGTQKKVNLTGAVSSVSSKTLGKIPVPNAQNLLQGMMPGLEVIQSSGRPGNDDPLIRVRGFGSFGASSSPLILIDGIIGSLSNVAPNDIENVTVLKDAASASIYGARAANGVILVTTKKAKRGEPSLQYKLDIGIQNATAIRDLVWNSAQYMEMFNSARLRSGLTPLYTDEQISDYKNATDRVQFPNYDWPDHIFKTATIYNHSLSFAKATETSNFRIGLNYSNQGGILPGFDSKRYMVNLNYENQVLKPVKVGAIINFYRKDETEPQGNGDGDIDRGVYGRSPLAMPFLPDGRKSSGRAYNTEPFSTFAPLTFTNGDIKSNTYSVKAQLFVTVDIFKGLQWETKAGINYDDFFRKIHTFGSPGEFYFYQKQPGESDYTVDASVGNPIFLGVSDYSSTSFTPTLYSTLKYSTKIGDHEINAMAGYEQQSNNFRELSGQRVSFPAASLGELNAGSPDGQSLAGTANAWALQSFFGRVAYNYQSKYFLEGNLRYDGTSRVQPDRRWGAFPSLSGAWRLSEEGFIKDNFKRLNNLKFRASYGLLGNQEIGLYPYQEIYSYANYSYGSSVGQGVALLSLTDRNLHWEKTKIFDLGLDLDAFDGLFGLSFDWYKKSTSDILAKLPVPASLGLQGPITNNGALENTGMELELRHSNNIGKLHYSANFQISGFKNRVTSIGTSTKGVIDVGLPYNSLYLYEWNGIFQDQSEIDKSAKQNNNPKPGDLKIKDQNGDNVIDAADRVTFSRFPKFDYSLNVSLEWKRFVFSFFLQGVEGSHAFLSDWSIFPFREGVPPTTDFLNAWTPENHSNTIPAIHQFDYAGVYGYTSTYLFRNTSYLRLKNVYLSYSLSENVVRTIKAKGISLYVSANNLLTITKFHDADPERPEGLTATPFPQLRIINFGFNVNF